MDPKIPKVTLEFLEWLERTFQFRIPDVDTNERQIWMDAGAAKVVRKVRSIYEEQNRTVLGPDAQYTSK